MVIKDILEKPGEIGSWKKGNKEKEIKWVVLFWLSVEIERGKRNNLTDIFLKVKVKNIWNLKGGFSTNGLACRNRCRQMHRR